MFVTSRLVLAHRWPTERFFDMPTNTRVLTDSFISTLRPAKGQCGWREIVDGACRGLRLRISPAGEKVWAIRNKVGTKRFRHTLGAYPEVPLSEARKRATGYLAAARDGLSPAAVDAREIGSTLTVAQAHRRYIAALVEGRVISSRTRALKEGMFRAHIDPQIGSAHIRRVRRLDIVGVVNGVSDRKGNPLPVQKNRVFSEVMALLRWCEQWQYVDGVPAIRKRDLRVLGAAKEQPRRRTLSDDEIRGVWTAAENLGELTRDFLHLLLLTGQRRDEVRLMTWGEVDLQGAVWTIPATRYKTRIDHVVPLPGQAVEILARRSKERLSSFVLAGRQSDQAFNGAASAMRRLRALLPLNVVFTLHDFRRTVRTGLSRLGIDEETAELVIGHTPQGIRRVYDLYDRMPQRRIALQLWSDHLLRLVKERETLSQAA